jgi:hypothetical protein
VLAAEVIHAVVSRGASERMSVIGARERVASKALPFPGRVSSFQAGLGRELGVAAALVGDPERVLLGGAFCLGGIWLQMIREMYVCLKVANEGCLASAFRSAFWRLEAKF